MIFVHGGSRLDQGRAHGLAIHAHPATYRAHRDPSPGEAHGLGLLVAATQVREYRGAVDAVSFSERLDAHPGQVVADKRFHLGSAEKRLSRLDSPHNRAAIILRSGILEPTGDLVDSTV